MSQNQFGNGYVNFLNSENFGNSQNSQNPPNIQNVQNPYPQNFQNPNPQPFPNSYPQNYQNPNQQNFHNPQTQYYPNPHTPNFQYLGQNAMPMFPQHDPGTPTSGQSQTPTHGTQGLESININEVPQRGRGGAQRGTTWSKLEERLVFTTWLTISGDSVVGTDQTGDHFWKRIGEYYNKYRDEDWVERTWKAVKSHFFTVNKQVTQFCGIYNQTASEYHSGWSDDQVMTTVRDKWSAIHGNKEFKFAHIWEVVKDQPKWKADTRSSKKTKMNEFGAYSSSSNAETNDDDNEDEVHEIRPIGQKAAKKRAKGKNKQLGEPSEVDAEKWSTLHGLSAEKNEHLKEIRRLREYDLIMKDTSGMSELQLDYHNKMVASIIAKSNF